MESKQYYLRDIRDAINGKEPSMAGVNGNSDVKYLKDIADAIRQGVGGTTVVANPEGQATAALEKLQVGENIYGITDTDDEIVFIKGEIVNNSWKLVDVTFDDIYELVEDGDRLAVLILSYPQQYDCYYILSAVSEGQIEFAYAGNNFALNNRVITSTNVFAVIVSTNQDDIFVLERSVSTGVKLDYIAELTATLTAGQTTLTFTDSNIQSSSVIDYYTSIFGVNPTDAVVTSGQLVLTFEAQDSDMSVKVRVS